MKLSEQGLRKFIKAFDIKNEVFFANKIERVGQIEFEPTDFDGEFVLTEDEAKWLIKLLDFHYQWEELYTDGREESYTVSQQLLDRLHGKPVKIGGWEHGEQGYEEAMKNYKYPWG